MRINKHITGRVLLLVSSTMLVQVASAEEVLLSSKPSKCISLNEGLVCYQNIQVQWQAPDIGDYCLVQTSSNQVLNCWEQQRKGQFKFEFSERQSEDYVLRQKDQGNDLADMRIDVKWVYKKNRRDRLRWKVF